MSFSIIMIIKKIFSVILHLSNNTKYHRPKVSEQDLAVGTEYATEELKDAQYRFVGMDKNSDAASGIVSEGMKHVIYLYEKVEAPVTPTGSVDAIYVTENGKIVSAQ